METEIVNEITNSIVIPELCGGRAAPSGASTGGQVMIEKPEEPPKPRSDGEQIDNLLDRLGISKAGFAGRELSTEARVELLCWQYETVFALLREKSVLSID